MDPSVKTRFRGLFIGAVLCLAPAFSQQNANTPGNQNFGIVTVQEQKQIQGIGYNAGYRAGSQDRQQNLPFNFQNHSAYQAANQGYFSSMGISLSAYQMNFRSGFENGYNDGYHGRIANASTQKARSYSAAPAASATPATHAQPDASAPPANTASPATETEHAAGVIPQGTVLQLKLNHTLSSSSSTPGTAFTATVTKPIYNPQGQVMVPVGSLVAGTVAQVHQAGKFTGQSTLSLNFQRLQLPDGHTARLQASLSHINNSQTGVLGSIGNVTQGTASANQEGQVSQSNTRATVGDVTAGTAVGTLIGALAGGGKGAGIGAALGAAAGLGTVLLRKNGALNLPAGTPISIKLNQPVSVQ